jgi:hypothetical protein
VTFGGKEVKKRLADVGDGESGLAHGACCLNPQRSRGLVK